MDKSTRRLLTSAGKIQLNSAVIATIILPIIIAIISRGVFGDVPPYVLITLICLQGIFGWIHLQGTKYLKMLFDLSHRQRTPTYEEQEEELSRLAAQSVVIQYMLNFLESLVEEQRSTSTLPINKEEILEKLIEPTDANRVDALGFDDPEVLFSCALFVFNGSELVIRARKRDSRLQARNRSRRKGEGHAGIAFERNQIWISPDASKETLLEPRAKPNGDIDAPISDADKKQYISFISIPFHAGDINSPVGVLTITSSKAGQFTRDKFEKFSQIYQDILSFFFVQFPELLINN